MKRFSVTFYCPAYNYSHTIRVSGLTEAGARLAFSETLHGRGCTILSCEEIK